MNNQKQYKDDVLTQYNIRNLFFTESLQFSFANYEFTRA